MVDGSNSVGDNNFENVKEALDTALDVVTMGPGNSRVGLVTYSTFVERTISLTFDKAALRTGEECDADGTRVDLFDSVCE